MAPDNSPTGSTLTGNSEVLDYLIDSSVQYMKSGEYAFAKCYLMTAAALAPDNFLIKYESYQMSKSEENISDAAKQFADIFSATSLTVPVTQSAPRPKKIDQQAQQAQKQKQFEQLKELFVEEMKFILYSIRDQWSELSRGNLAKHFALESADGIKVNFYRKLFDALKKDQQISCLIKFSTFFTEPTEVVIDLLLFIIVKYSNELTETLSECASRLIDIKHQLELDKQATEKAPLINHLRKKYIFYILPALFSDSAPSSIEMDLEVTKKYFFNALNYFIEDFILKQSKSPQTVSNKQEFEQKLIEIVALIGKRHKWKLFNSTKFSITNLDHTINTISTFVHSHFPVSSDQPIDLSAANPPISKSDNKTDPQDQSQVLYYCLVLFVICFSEYAKAGDECVLVERLHCGFDETKSFLPSKKRKIIQQYQQQPKVIASSKAQIENFSALIKLKKIFVQLFKEDYIEFLTHVNLLTNESYIQLKIDTLLHGGLYGDAKLLIPAELPSGGLSILKRNMQLITANIKANDSQIEVDYLVSLIALIATGSKEDNVYLKCLKKSPLDGAIDEKAHKQVVYGDLNSLLELSSSSLTRQLIILPLTLDNVVAFIVDACICVLKKSVLRSLLPYDLGFGHLVVLTQYNWPYYFEVFQKTVANIVNRATSNTSLALTKFVYPLFSKYVLMPDIIEEFMSLVEEKEIITFDFNPATPEDPNQPLNLHSTRGVTRTYKEDIRSLLVKQMAISNNILSVDMFLGFLITEIRPYFAQLNQTV